MFGAKSPSLRQLTIWSCNFLLCSTFRCLRGCLVNLVYVEWWPANGAEWPESGKGLRAEKQTSNDFFGLIDKKLLGS